MSHGAQITVTMKHIREALLCAGGARRWFVAHGFDWSDFLLNGKAVEEIEGTGDALALRVAAIARKEAVDGRG